MPKMLVISGIAHKAGTTYFQWSHIQVFFNIFLLGQEFTRVNII